MSVRKVITRSGRHFRGRYPSLKCGRMVEFESLLERDVILLLEFSSAIMCYREQPELVSYSDGDSVKKYFPDFEAVLLNGVRLHIEVKPSQKLLAPKVSKTYQAVAKHYQCFRTERFLIVTEHEARVEPLHSNLKTLGAIRSKSRIAQPWRVSAISTKQPTSWAILEANMGRDQLLRAIASGHFSCDLRKPLEGNLPVFTHGEKSDSLYL